MLMKVTFVVGMASLFKRLGQKETEKKRGAEEDRKVVSCWRASRAHTVERSTALAVQNGHNALQNVFYNVTGSLQFLPARSRVLVCPCVLHLLTDF